MPEPRISLATIVRNEEARLPRMLASVDGLVSEKVLVDTGSTDGTVALARRLGCQVAEIPWPDDFAQARNAALDRVTGDWVLVLDADDTLQPESFAVIHQALQDTPRYRAEGRGEGFAFPVDECDNQGWLIGQSWSTARLFPARPDVRYVGCVHEDVFPGTPALLLARAKIVHTGYDPALLPAKYARNRRLLHRRIATEPGNPLPIYYLASQEDGAGHHAQADVLATSLLDPQPHPGLPEAFVERLRLIQTRARAVQPV